MTFIPPYTFFDTDTLYASQLNGAFQYVENPISTNSLTKRSLSDRFSDITNVLDFGANPDTILLVCGIKSTNGSNVITFSNSTPPVNFTRNDIGKAIVISCIGDSYDSYTIRGNVELLPAPAIKPLSSVIINVLNSSTIILRDNVKNTYEGSGAMVTYGSDNSAAFQAAFKSIPFGGRIFVPSGYYGFTTPIVVPYTSEVSYDLRQNSYLFTGNGTGKSNLVALAAPDPKWLTTLIPGYTLANALIQETNVYHYGLKIDSITLDANGVVDYAYYINSNVGGGSLYNSNFQNALIADVYVGSSVTMYNCQTDKISNMWSVTGVLNGVQKTYPDYLNTPPYNLYVASTDNTFALLGNNRGSVAIVRDIASQGDNSYNFIHNSGKALYSWWLNGHTNIVNCEADGFVIAGVKMDGNFNQWIGGRLFREKNTNSYAFIVNGIQNVIFQPGISEIANQYFITGTDEGIIGSQIVIPRADPKYSFNNINALFATTTNDKSVVQMISTNAISNTLSANSNIWLGTNNSIFVEGKLMMQSENASAVWSISAYFITGDAGTDPALKYSEVYLICSDGSFSLPQTPEIVPTGIRANSYTIKVKGLAGTTCSWKFYPNIYAG